MGPRESINYDIQCIGGADMPDPDAKVQPATDDAVTASCTQSADNSADIAAKSRKAAERLAAHIQKPHMVNLFHHPRHVYDGGKMTVATERDEVLDRISSYLAGGGVFNPELANHAAVRDLIVMCGNRIRADAIEKNRLRESFDAAQKLASAAVDDLKDFTGSIAAKSRKAAEAIMAASAKAIIVQADLARIILDTLERK